MARGVQYRWCPAMRPPSSSLVRLNLETQMHHAAADRAWTELVAGDRIPTEHDYMHCLVRTYGFEAPLEAALAYTPHFESLVDMTGRYRSGQIAQDLLELGLEASQVSDVPQCMLAPFSSIAEALGWLYVHERATLCHEAVRRELVQRAPKLARATSYLGAYKGIVNMRIEDLGRVIEQYTRTPLIEDRIVAAAQAGFRALRG